MSGHNKKCSVSSVFHFVVLTFRISSFLHLDLSLSSIDHDRFCRQHLVFSLSWCKSLLAGQHKEFTYEFILTSSAVPRSSSVGKKWKFNHTTKRYMHKSKSLLVNETHKILWDFDIQTDHLILARRLNLVIIDNKNPDLPYSWLCRPSGPQSENQRNRIEKSTWIFPEN